ncbi:MAG: hypothetical protein COA38_02880 [Fluviicola sp.]|nr:MAG: hypothetical protein COA38_02880 [Fluviicola sp.]
MEFEIKPYIGVGVFEFDARRSKNREELSDHDDDLYCHARTDGKSPDDSYKNLGLEFIYTKYNRLGAMELMEPSIPLFKGRNLLESTWNELLNLFQQLDPEIQVSDKDLISYKLGIAIFAPEKNENPFVKPTSITVFDEKFFTHKVGVANPEHLNSFHIHVPYVGISKEITYNGTTAEELLKNAFSDVSEKGIILWNQVPIAFEYSEDLPLLLNPIVELLESIKAQTEGKSELNFECPSFSMQAKIKWNDKFILIDSDWTRINGGYESALKADNPPIGQLTLMKNEFLSEWKILLEQCVNTLKGSNVVVVTSESRVSLNRLKSIERWIPHYGKFYRENQSILTVQTDGRKSVDFRKMSFVKVALIAIVLIGLVLLPVLFSESTPSTYWFISLLRSVGILLIVGIPLYFIARNWLKNRRLK